VAKVTAEQFLTLMSKQIGYVERPINKTKYSRKFGVRVAQWCGYLHNWVAVKCGWKLGVHVPNTAYTLVDGVLGTRLIRPPPALPPPPR